MVPDFKWLQYRMCYVFFWHLCVLLHRCSPYPTMWQEGWFTSLVRHPATQAHSALQVLWRVHLCITSIWTSRVKLHQHSTRPCLALPQVRRTFIYLNICYCSAFCHEKLWVTDLFLCSDPNMVNAYMYQAAGTNGQPAAAPGQAPPTTSPPYSNYQPTPTQAYQVFIDILFLCINRIYILLFIDWTGQITFASVLRRMWSLRPRVCLQCHRLPPLMVWLTWATSHTACKTWYQHCQDRTTICLPNSRTCQASSPCTSRSVQLFCQTDTGTSLLITAH